MRLPWVFGYIERAAWLSETTLVAVGWCLAPPEALRVWVHTPEGPVVATMARWLAYPRPDLAMPTGAGRALVVCFATACACRLSGPLVIEAGGIRFSTSLSHLQRVTSDLPSVVHLSMQWLDSGRRADILAMLLSVLEGDTETVSRLAPQIAAVRDVLRERFPVRQIEAREPVGTQLDYVLRIDERSFYLKGWAYAVGGIARLTAIAPEGQRAELLGRAFRYDRRDVESIFGTNGSRTGFIAYVTLDQPSFVTEGWTVEVVSQDGVTAESPPARVTAAQRSAICNAILGDTDLDPLSKSHLIENHSYPALSRLQQLEGLGYIERAVWLSDTTLVAVGWCLAPPDALRVWAQTPEGPVVAATARWLAYPRPDLATSAGAGRAMLVRFATPCAHHLSGPLVIEAGGIRFSTSAAHLQRVTSDLASVIRLGMERLDPARHADLLAMLLSVFHDDTETAFHLAPQIAAIRDVLRERFQVRRIEAREQVGTQLDYVLRIDARSFYLKGWVYAVAGPARLTVVAPEGQRAELLGWAFRYDRPDVESIFGTKGAKAGFIAYVTLDQPSFVTEGWTVEVVSRDRLTSESPPARVIADPSAIRDAILADTDLDPSSRGGLIDNHSYPALSRLQQLEGPAQIDETIDFGDVPTTPDVSIVIPLYQRVDFLEQQLAQFVDDPEMRRAELVYVLDSPELAQYLRQTAHDLYDLYRLPFRLAVLERSVGFASANNAGVSVSRGRLLLLLNSDVLPSRPGWLRPMIEFYDRTPSIGALGVKLLYEDDTVQHAGLYFQRSSGSLVWENQHYHKGFERSFRPVTFARKVPAVTAACLMISRRLYEQHGGLSGVYVKGDYEDSDLCLRLLEDGRDNWYLPEVELYHLEAQSYSWASRARFSRYNAWVHTRLWNDTLAATMTRFNSQDAARESRMRIS